MFRQLTTYDIKSSIEKRQILHQSDLSKQASKTVVKNYNHKGFDVDPEFENSLKVKAVSITVEIHS